MLTNLLNIVFVCKVVQKDIYCDLEQVIQFHARMEKSHLLDVGLKFHLQHFNFEVNTFSSILWPSLLDVSIIWILVPWKYNCLTILFVGTSARHLHRIIVLTLPLVLIYLSVEEKYIILLDILSFPMWRPMEKFPNFLL